MTGNEMIIRRHTVAMKLETRSIDCNGFDDQMGGTNEKFYLNWLVAVFSRLSTKSSPSRMAVFDAKVISWLNCCNLPHNSATSCRSLGYSASNACLMCDDSSESIILLLYRTFRERKDGIVLKSWEKYQWQLDQILESAVLQLVSRSGELNRNCGWDSIHRGNKHEWQDRVS